MEASGVEVSSPLILFSSTSLSRPGEAHTRMSMVHRPSTSCILSQEVKTTTLFLSFFLLSPSPSPPSPPLPPSPPYSLFSITLAQEAVSLQILNIHIISRLGTGSPLEGEDELYILATLWQLRGEAGKQIESRACIGGL